MDEPGRPDIYSQWFSFYFLGSDKFTIWNAHIRSAKKYFWEQVESHARDRATSMLTCEEQAEEFSWAFVPATRSSTGKITGYTLAKKTKKIYEQFEGRTFSDQCRKYESEIIKNEPPEIYESFQIDRSYVYGIGLDIVVDASVINQAVIEQTIARFREIGERNWKSENPVFRESLPYITEQEALEGEDRSSPAWVGSLVRADFSK
ncbi:MAG: hypothetical protein ACRDE7_00760 [Sphingobacterium sp.]